MRRSLATLLLFAQASVALHLAVGAHQTSLLTGELVEAHDLACAPVAAQTAPLLDTGCAHLGTHDEDRCEAFAFTRSLASVRATVSAVAVAVTARREAVQAPAQASPPLDVLSVAPKSSPPV